MFVTLRSFGVFSTRVNSSLNLFKIWSVGKESLFHLLSLGGWLTEQNDSGFFFCFTSIPSFDRLSFLSMLCSCPPVMNNGVSSQIYPLDWVQMIIFPRILIVLSVKPQHRSLILFSPG